MERKKCAYCQELAVAYQVTEDGRRVAICAYHIPPASGDDLPELRTKAGHPGKAD